MTHFRPGKQAGFTLLELMIIVGVLGVIASIALVSYSNYLDISRAAAMAANYESAVDVARGNYVVARQRANFGAPIDEVIPSDAAGWADMLNTAGSKAPGGGEAYTVGPGSGATGTVGIQFTGDYAAATSVVTISRPAYNGLPATTEVISQSSF